MKNFTKPEKCTGRIKTIVAGKRTIKFTPEILEDLADFTGIEIGDIIPYFDNSRADHTRIELDQFVQPNSREELIWYYRCCRSEFVANATKYAITGKGWPLLDKWVKRQDSVLDYGAGTGQNSIHLWKNIGAYPHYFEISILQVEFFRFRCKKRGIAVPVIEPYTVDLNGNYKFDPINSIYGIFNIVMLSQVLEHIPNPEELLKHLVGKLTNRGLLLEDTPWSSHNYSSLVSLTADQFEKLMGSLGMKKLAHGVWQRCQRNL